MRRPVYATSCLILIFLFFCLYSHCQSAGIDTVRAAVEAEVEIKTDSDDGTVAGAVGVSVAAAALSPFSGAGIKTSGSLTVLGITPATTQNPADSTRERKNIVNPNDAPPMVGFGETEAEAEVESEAEVEVSNGAAVAAGGSGVGTAAGGRSIYLTAIGGFALYPIDISMSLDAQTSTSTDLSTVNILYPSTDDMNQPQITDPTRGSMPEPVLDSTNNIQSAFDIPYADATTIPILQTNTEAEVESESEAEAEAEAAPGAAAAAATGGTAVSSAGDYARSEAVVRAATSTSTSEVNIQIPPFINMPSSSNSEPLAPGMNEYIFVKNLGPNRLDPTASEGKGLFEAEAETEVEVEAEVEVDNNSAAAAAVSSGGAGANGIGATARVASSSSVSTSTELDTGNIVRDIGDGVEEYDTFSSFAQNESDTEVTAEAEAEATVVPVAAAASGDTSSVGDARAAGITLIATTEDAINTPVDQFLEMKSDTAEDIDEQHALLRSKKYAKRTSTGNLETEDEAEAQVEAVAVIGFNSAAAAAAATAGQARNSLLDVPADASAATCTSTSVYDNPAARTAHTYDLGPSPSGDNGGLPPVDFSYSDLTIEKEVEAEAEAEVGFQAAAVAMAASGAGSENLIAIIDHRIDTHYAAAAAGVGTEVILEFVVPASGQAGMVWAKATAIDTTGGPVAIAIAVAGIPTIDGVNNELEIEVSGDSLVSDSAMIFTDPANLVSPKVLERDPAVEDAPGDTIIISTDGFFESEAEAKSEAEAEAGYGVAAASAAASSAGAFSVSAADSRTITSMPDYLCTNTVTNTWLGGDGNWYSDTANWSLGRFPTTCDHVVIPAGDDVRMLSGEESSIYTLHVEQGAHLHVPTSAELSVLTIFE